MNHQNCHDDNCQVCGLRAFERNRYFDGKFLVTRDFVDEQQFFIGKHHLHNKMLHGYGTVCGLKVVQHPNPACQHQYVVLQPGMALDCCGRELIVADEIVVDIRQLIEATLREAGNFPPSGAGDIFLRLVYQECDREAVPVLLDDCEGCNEDGAEFNRTREGYRLLVSTTRPADAVSDPLDARLEWQHTLDTAHPRALVFDRDIMRMYLAEWDGETGWLRMYDAGNHSLISQVDLAGEPTAITRAALGDLVYVARSAPAEGSAGIAVFDQPRLETTPDTALRAVLSVPGDVSTANIVRLGASPLDNSLFALTADGQMLRWSAEDVRDWVNSDGGGDEPAPFARDLAGDFAPDDPPAVERMDLALSTDGRWMVVSDGSAPRLIVLNLSAFSATDNPVRSFDLPADRVPAALELSFDGEYLYALCVNPADRAEQYLYRIQLRDTLEDFIPAIPAERDQFSVLNLVDPEAAAPLPLAVDVAVSPRDNWIYILRRLFESDAVPQDRGEVLIVPVEPLDAQRGPDAISAAAAAQMIVRGSYVEGSARFANLALLGQRLYVAGETPAGDDEAVNAGSISILFVDEASCGTHIRRVLDSCETCDSAETGVILMSIQGYVWNRPIVEDAEGVTTNLIDNFTYRPLVPSTNTLRKVIECMLAKGISEGIPGPRGPVGPNGPAGDPGEQGPRGPGIQSVTANAVIAGLAPTVTLSTIPGDAEGDLALTLGIPRGAAITDAAINQGPLAVQLEPINPAIPTGDRRLILTIPQAQAPQPPAFNHVVKASWNHGESRAPDDLIVFLTDTGLIVSFAEPLAKDTVNALSVFVSEHHREPLQIRGLDRQLERECECYIPNLGLTLSEDGLDLRIDLPEDWLDPLVFREGQITRLTVTLRGDWLLGVSEDGETPGRALDGNHIMPGVNAGRPSGNATEGGDWISVILIEG
ncbi:MAG: collagen-like protein [Oscillochloris sp.]|nr:collagen-like protein [Oscillochloris sp.]